MPVVARRASPLPFPRFVTAYRAAMIAAILFVAASLGVTLAGHAPVYILLATTTSTRDTGLLDYLDPFFEADTGIEVRYVAVGTGQALDLGRRGDADALLVHAPSLEIAFMLQGHGLCRSPVMYNRFLVAGPASDPAGIRGLTNATEAFRRIWETNSTFVSRGDDSGTNVKELQLWSLVGYTPTTDDAWYVETGQGMAATLTVASEKGGYTLTDDGTFYAQLSALALEIDVSGDPFLANHYHVIVVNPTTHPGVSVGPALEFARWLVSPRGQALIGGYEIGGRQLFTPEGQDEC